MLNSRQLLGSKIILKKNKDGRGRWTMGVEEMSRLRVDSEDRRVAKATKKFIEEWVV